MIQEIIVGKIVVAAGLVVLKRYGPKRLRDAMVRGQIRAAAALGMKKTVTRLRGKQASACGGCDACEGGQSGKSGGPAAPKKNSITPEALKRTIPR